MADEQPLFGPDSLKLVKPSDFDLNACGQPVEPEGLVYLDIPAWLLYSNRVAVASGATTPTVLIDEKKYTFKDTAFYLTEISGEAQNNVFVRFRYSTGRYTSNVRQHSFEAFSLGNMRRSISPAQRYPAGSFIGIEIENRSTANTYDAIFMFGGFKRYYFKPS